MRGERAEDSRDQRSCWLLIVVREGEFGDIQVLMFCSISFTLRHSRQAASGV